MKDMERLERALRQQPPDEPVYVPGTYRRRTSRGRSILLAVPVLGAAVVFGVALGSGLLATRERIDGPGDASAIAGALRGSTWVSEELTTREWVDGLVERGLPAADVTAFLEHENFRATVQYRLTFGQSDLSIEASFDRARNARLGGGLWRILDDGTLEYREIVPGISAPDACVVKARPTIEDASLTLDVEDAEGCAMDERIAGSAVFDLVPYTPATP